MRLKVIEDIDRREICERTKIYFYIFNIYIKRLKPNRPKGVRLREAITVLRVATR
nr:MAG TPA: hypothetical protein [Caudoviricetes sp.]DAU17210.1 MAG TPA: hypothetical protein [Caudoviricetes sp.]DAW87597.1 MAG TPA: hypothetical protein [Caudoviricetes sp.]